MRRVIAFLPYISRGLAICAVLAGLVVGLIEASFGASFVCVDSCPTRTFYFAYMGPTAVRLLTPCLALATLAVATFVTYCLATHQARRIVLPLLVLSLGGLAGGALLGALALHAHATLPIWGGEEGDLLREAPLIAWRQQWGAAIALVAGTWSSALVYLQWRR